MLIPTELGGGIRNLDTVELILKAGIDRVILGTAAVENRNLVKDACRKYGNAIILGIDARNNNLATRGWQEQTNVQATDFARSMVGLGIQRIIYTDISRDGTLTEPNYNATFEMVKAAKIPVVASGGISSINHLKLLKQLGVEGAIIGRALYTGNIDLKRAQAVIND